MPAEARISSIWKKQKLLVAIMLLAVSGYFFYDGAVGYPRANVRYQEWKSYVDAGRESEWPARAAQLGLKANEWDAFIKEHHPTGPPPEVRWDHGKLTEQFVCSALSGALGVIALLYWLTQKGRVIRSDEEGILTPAGTRVPFGAITGVGKKQWDKKGIAVIRYELGGRRGQFHVDDYKFETEPSRKILAEIEAHLVAKAAAAAADPAAPLPPPSASE